MVIKKLKRLSQSSDAILAVGIFGLIMLLVIPLPPLFLDALLSLSIVLSVMTLLLSVYVENALEFNSFPSLLLILTLFRLGLNIASTRMILTDGEAGDIINTFGEFVIKGNVAVGLILFILLTMINFVVVTKGAGRIAEVAARFTLEALPGKQMGIDAELANGLLTQKEAKEARSKVALEAEFYGAMDGASKFVKGDAIAGILILLVNIFGGLAIGLTVKHLSFQECLKTYTQLTVGDGLVTQIPALLVSVGAGIMVTRASSGKLSKLLPHQVFRNPKVLLIAATILLALGFIPGMPFLVMLPMAFVLGFYGYLISREKNAEGAASEVKEEASENVEKAMLVHPLEIELGYQLLSHAETLRQKIPEIRRRVAAKLGIILPSIHICDNMELAPHSYQIKIKGIKVAIGEKAAGIAAQLTEAVEEHAHELLNRQDVVHLLENAKIHDSAVVEELIPNKLALGLLVKILQNLLREQVSIRDFVTILEVLADQILHDPSADIEKLTETVRSALSKRIFHALFGEIKKIHAITLDPKVEQTLNVSLQKTEIGSRLMVRPTTARKIKEQLSQLMEKAGKEGIFPVILTHVSTRPHLRRLVEKAFPHLHVFSYSEVAMEIEILPFGTVSSETLM